MGILTYSRNVFVPVTNLCRNRCGYCSFRRESDRAKTISRSEAISLLAQGAEAGCTEALFSSGESPWEVPGFDGLMAGTESIDMVDYLVELCEQALERGLLPHTNAGVLSRENLSRLAPFNASMGLMLETTTDVDAHRASPGKRPRLRLDYIAEAGKLGIPFTTGILVGIGECWEDRLASLEAIADLQRRYGHIQEAIIQPLDPKPGTPMAGACPPGEGELAEVVKVARQILPGSIAIQIPPNLLNPRPLIAAGASDLGGISPITPDWINPERPWPRLEELEGYNLRERLPVYPRYVLLGWYGRRTEDVVKALAGPDGLRRR
jgi:FO synthase subunit 1